MGEPRAQRNWHQSPASPLVLSDNEEENVADETTRLLAPVSTAKGSSDIQQMEQNMQNAKQTLLGMLCVACGTGLICTGGSIVAIIGGSVLEIMLIRFGVMLVLTLVWWCVKHPTPYRHWFGDSPDRLNVWVRGALCFVLVYGWYRGLELVPIGDAEAIIFVTPLLIVLIARLVLKEELSKVFPVSLVLTVVGIVFVCQPEFIFGSDDDTRAVSIIGIVFLFVMSIAWALTSILVRTAKNTHWLQIQIVAAIQGCFIWTPLLILLNRFVFHSDMIAGGHFTPLDNWYTVTLMMVCALCGFAGLSLNVVGYQIGDATKVSMMEYCDLIFAYVFQWSVFGIAPDKYEWIGIGCLLLVCVVHVVEEGINLRRSRMEYEKMTNAIALHEANKTTESTHV